VPQSQQLSTYEAFFAAQKTVFTHCLCRLTLLAYNILAWTETTASSFFAVETCLIVKLLFINGFCIFHLTAVKKNARGLNLQANYTAQATAACQRS
jgi:hypothetical protein